MFPIVTNTCTIEKGNESTPGRVRVLYLSGIIVCTFLCVVLPIEWLSAGMQWRAMVFKDYKRDALPTNRIHEEGRHVSNNVHPRHNIRRGRFPRIQRQQKEIATTSFDLVTSGL